MKQHCHDCRGTDGPVACEGIEDNDERCSEAEMRAAFVGGYCASGRGWTEAIVDEDFNRWLARREKEK